MYKEMTKKEFNKVIEELNVSYESILQIIANDTFKNYQEFRKKGYENASNSYFEEYETITNILTEKGYYKYLENLYK